jgi:hypothetical protein
MNDKKWRIAAGMAFIMGVILLLVPYIFPVCDGMVETAKGGAVPMKCHWTYQAEMLISAAVALAALGQFFLKGAEARRLSAVVMIFLGIAAGLLLQNWVIGICNSAAMACHITAAWTTRAAFILMILGIWEVRLTFQSARGMRKKP